MLVVLQLQELRQRRKGKRSQRRPVGATRRWQATCLSGEAVLEFLRNMLVNVVLSAMERQAPAPCTRLLVPRLLSGSLTAAYHALARWHLESSIAFSPKYIHNLSPALAVQLVGNKGICVLRC